MKYKSLVVIMSAWSLFTSCSMDLQRKYDNLSVELNKLQEKCDSLSSELEKYQNTPEQLKSQAEVFISNMDTVALSNLLKSAIKYHPSSDERKFIERELLKIKDNVRKQKEKEMAERLAAVKKLKKKYDDISGITWYYNPYFTHYNNSNNVSIYIGQNDKRIWLRLMMSYCGDDWIFFDNAYLSYEGNTYEIFFDKYQEKETDNNVVVWEWIDVPVTSSILNYLRLMVDGKQPKMRLSGKYTKTRNLSTNEIRGIKDVLLAYDVLEEENSRGKIVENK